jgi:DNA polymerase-1
VPGVTLDLGACRVQDYDQAQVVELFRELEFRTLVDRLPPSTRAMPPVEAGPGGQLALFGQDAPAESQPAAQDPSPYAVIDSEAALAELVQTLRRASLIAFDTETTAIDAQQAELVGIALAWGEGLSAYVPVGHQLPTVNGQLSIFNWEIGTGELVNG